MYIHAYQSYVWNAIVSERIKTWGANKPVSGDLVLEPGTAEQAADSDDVDTEVGEANIQTDAGIGQEFIPVRLLGFSHPLFPDEPGSGRKSRKPWQPPRVKTLTEEDVDKYSIFDVVMPLPGNDVAFPEGELGKKYREYLLRDGLDPGDFKRRQK